MVMEAIQQIDTASSSVPWLFTSWKIPDVGLLFGPGRSEPGRPLTLFPLSIAITKLSFG